MGAGGSHPQAKSDPRRKKKETRVLRWADCNNEEDKENEEEVEEEKEAGQREMMETDGFAPPFLTFLFLDFLFLVFACWALDVPMLCCISSPNELTSNL